MMGMILNDWNDDGCSCLGCRAGGVLLAPLLPAPSPPAPLPLLSGVLGERGVDPQQGKVLVSGEGVGAQVVVSVWVGGWGSPSGPSSPAYPALVVGRFEFAPLSPRKGQGGSQGCPYRTRLG